MTMLHEVLKREVVAERYYSLLGRTYQRRAAGKQLAQDANIDPRVLKKAVKQLVSEALEIF